MRKSKTHRPLRFLFILAGALLLLAAFAPRANADCPGCIRYYNFEGTPTAPYPVNLASHVPAFEVGLGFRAFLNTGTDPTLAATGAYPTANTSAEAGIPFNLPPGDPDPHLTSVGIHQSVERPAFIAIPIFS